MRYSIDGYEIRSENSAKPIAQTSQYLVDLLNELGPFQSALDYGCGKLRYAVHLQRLAKRLTLIDSDLQLSRSQLLFGEPTSVREYAKDNWPRSRVFDHLEFRKQKASYDFALCANVLTAIPHVRTRAAILKLLRERLTSRGRCLVVCQHTNSYFTQHMADKDVKKYADGFVIGEKDNASFYGIIRPATLKEMVLKSGMAIERTWVNDQSGYVIATRGNRS